MVTLAFLVAACLDPVQAALVLVIIVAYRGPLPIVVAGAATALLVETVMALAAPGYVWGELIAPRLVAALLQAAVSLFAIWLIRSAAKPVTAALHAGQLADDGGATAAMPTALPAGLPTALDALDPRPVPPRMALWHKRAYVSHRVSELRKKKYTALNCESR